MAEVLSKKPTPLSADTPKYKTASHHPDLLNEEVEQLLLYRYGLENEFTNGPDMKIAQIIRKNAEVTPETLSTILESFNSTSQLGRDPLALKLGISTDLHQETKSEAIARCATQVESWLNANQSVMPQEEQDTISTALDAYKSAYANVGQSLVRAQQLLENTPARGEGRAH